MHQFAVFKAAFVLTLTLMLMLGGSLAQAQTMSQPTSLPAQAHAPAAVPDTLAERVQACTTCHGQQGRATSQDASPVYFPRIAGKPAGYLFNQLVNFREGRRSNVVMAALVQNLSDDYLRDIAGYFAALDLPYPPSGAGAASASTLARGAALVREGDAGLHIPACVRCHGAALTGVVPAVPGLLGLPRDYLLGQFGAWKAGQRRAAEPDCMAQIAARLRPDDVAAVATWLAAQPVPAPALAHPAAPGSLTGSPSPMDCGSMNQPPGRAWATVPASSSASSLGFDAVSRGGYLARIGNCMGCHTARGGPAYAGGLGLPTPFGTVYTPNITPDAATGLGSWSSDDFWQALHNGRSRKGRLLLPAFPYTSYTWVTRPDADDLFAYLRSLPPVRMGNRPHALRWPYNLQAGLWLWRAWYFRPAPPGSALPRGAYLVRGLGHCSACHAPRNAFGAEQDPLDLSGGLMPMQNWYAPSLAALAEAGVPQGVQGLDEVARLLRHGSTAQAVATGPMAEVVGRSTQYLSEADARAMAGYLQGLTRQTGLPRAPDAAASSAQLSGEVATQMQQGSKLYIRHCAACHGDQGQGAWAGKGPGGEKASIQADAKRVPAYPALSGNRSVTLASPANVIHAIVAGGYAPSTAGNPQPYGMPPFGLVLDDTQLAALATYVRRAWGNQAPAVTRLDVLRFR